MRYRQFEIWLADLSPRFGTEAGKTRPVLIVQSNLLNRVHPSSIICPLTTNVKMEASILRVDLKKGDAGMTKDSSIMIDQIRAIDNMRFLKKIGDLPKPLQRKVLDNLAIVLDMG